MNIVPALRVTRFEQLAPGELFILFSGSERFYALKTKAPNEHSEPQMVVLGPRFIAGDNESFLLAWQASTVLSYGKDFSVVPSSHPDHWFDEGSRRTPVCLAISEERAYICTNGAHSPAMFTPRYVEMATGTVEHRLSNPVFTTHWRIEIVSSGREPLVLLHFPSAASASK